MKRGVRRRGVTKLIFAAIAAASCLIVLEHTAGAAVPTSIEAIPWTTPQVGVNSGYCPTFPTPLQALVLNSSGEPLSGVTVTFTAPNSGPSAYDCNGGGSQDVEVTNSEGIATAPSFGPNTRSANGSYQILATVNGVASPATFDVTNSSTTPLSLSTEMTSTPQAESVGAQLHNSLQALLQDQNGIPQYDQTVSFQVWSLTSSGTPSSATALFSGSESATSSMTDSQGVATATPLHLGGKTGQLTVVASSPLAWDPTVFDVSVLPGKPDEITPLPWTNFQTQQNGGYCPTFAVRLGVQVLSPTGRPVARDPVTFLAPNSGPTAYDCNGGGGQDVETTNTTGIAVAPGFGPNTRSPDGSYELEAYAPGAEIPAIFTLDNSGSTPNRIYVVSPKHGVQSTDTNHRFPDALIVKILNESGGPVQGVQATFNIWNSGQPFTYSSGGASAHFSKNRTTLTNTSNAAGEASAPAPSANGKSGTFYITISAPNTYNPARLTLTNLK